MKNKRNRTKNNQSALKRAEPDMNKPLIRVDTPLNDGPSSMVERMNQYDIALKRIDQIVKGLVDECNELRSQCANYERMLFDSVTEFEHKVVPPPKEFSDDYDCEEKSLSLKRQKISEEPYEQKHSEESESIEDQSCTGKNEATSMETIEEEELEEESEIASLVFAKGLEARRDFSAEDNRVFSDFVDYYLLNVIKDNHYPPQKPSLTEHDIESIENYQKFYQNDALEFFLKIEQIYTINREKSKDFPELPHYLGRLGVRVEDEILCLGGHEYNLHLRKNYNIMKLNDLRSDLVEKLANYPHLCELLDQRPFPFAEFMQKMKLDHVQPVGIVNYDSSDTDEEST